MGTVTDRASLLIRRITSSIANLLPGPPSRDPLPPDVDGRRDTGADDDLAVLEAKMQAKDGHGGVR